MVTRASSASQARTRRALEKLAAEALRQEAHALYTAKRQLREGLAWLKSVARFPMGNHVTKWVPL